MLDQTLVVKICASIDGNFTNVETAIRIKFALIGVVWGRWKNVLPPAKAHTDVVLVVQERNAASLQRLLYSIDVFAASAQHAMTSLEAQEG